MNAEPTVHSAAVTAPSKAWRAKVSFGAGTVACLFVMVLYSRQEPGVFSDWDPTWVATVALLRGENPYEAIQVPPWPNWLLYPLPALLVTVPFAYLPLPLARGLFVAIGTAAFTYAITRRQRWSLYFLISGAMIWSWITVQWPPLLIAAVLTPSLSWLLVVKPTMGFALWAAWPNRIAVIGVLLLLGISLLIRPDWVQDWLASVAKTPHQPHLFRPLGFLLLLGMLRWRTPEGRLLAILSLVPQTTGLYETLPLALICRNRPEAAGFASLTMLAHLAYKAGPQGPWPMGAEYQWWVMLVLVYLPAIVLVLRRPNEAQSGWVPV
jgi:hypothetical protein